MVAARAWAATAANERPTAARNARPTCACVKRPETPSRRKAAPSRRRPASPPSRITAPTIAAPSAQASQVVSHRMPYGVCTSTTRRSAHRRAQVGGDRPPRRHPQLRHPATVKPTHLIGGYAQLSYTFNYLGPPGTSATWYHGPQALARR